MSGLAMIYKKHLNDADVPQATKKAVTWIKDKILHGYYMTGMEDRYVAFFEKSVQIMLSLSC
jgi:sister-chromatid-cohesion protein PDS5